MALYPVVSTNSNEAIFMRLFGSSSSKAAEPFTTVHRSFCWKLGELRAEDFVLERMMVSFLMIMFNELKNRLA